MTTLSSYRVPFLYGSAVYFLALPSSDLTLTIKAATSAEMVCPADNNWEVLVFSTISHPMGYNELREVGGRDVGGRAAVNLPERGGSTPLVLVC